MSVEFTPKEEAIIKIVWRCLKNGPPEVDMDKLRELGGFNTTKTTVNTWGVIKRKLMADDNDTPMPATPKKAAGEPSTPRVKKGTATPARKRTKKVASAGDSSENEETVSLSRKKAKTPVKKGDMTFNSGAEEV